MSRAEMAEKYKVTDNAIGTAAKVLGKQDCIRSMRKKKMSKETLLSCKGRRPIDVARETGYTCASVCETIRRNSLESEFGLAVLEHTGKPRNDAKNESEYFNEKTLQCFKCGANVVKKISIFATRMRVMCHACKDRTTFYDHPMSR